MEYFGANVMIHRAKGPTVLFVYWHPGISYDHIIKQKQGIIQLYFCYMTHTHNDKGPTSTTSIFSCSKSILEKGDAERKYLDM